MAEAYTPCGKSVLLHICCAPCGGPCVERLLNAGCRVELYYSNSNIDTLEEYEKRLHWVRVLAEHYGVKLHTDPYDHGDWLSCAGGLAGEPEGGARCRTCFRRVLGRTRGMMERLGLECFTTTLTVSPHKSSRMIFACGGEFPGFEAVDFKKLNGFARSVEIAKALGFYRQQYCGCEFGRIAADPEK